jgi:hypothetical protein
MNVIFFTILLATTTFLSCITGFNFSPFLSSAQAGNYGYVNKKGLLVIKPQFSEVQNFSQGLAAVKVGDNWGYIDKTGKVVIKPQYSDFCCMK